jgi:serpin B
VTVRRVLPMLTAVGLLALGTAGCGDEPSSMGIAHIESKVAHPRATEAEGVAGAEIITHVGAELYGPIARAAADGNVAYSPLSIGVTLGMARAGADGESAEQLDAFFGDADPATLHRSLNGAAESLQQLAGPVQLPSGELADIELTNANALWGQSGAEWQPTFLDELRRGYDASMWTADYLNDAERARFEINDWVASRTGEEITDLIPQGVLDDDTRLVLTNAVYFAAPWNEELDVVEEDQPFTTAAGGTVDAPFLSTTEQLVHQQGDRWQAVTLPYGGAKLAMTFIVPDEGELAAFEEALDADLLHQAVTGGEPTTVDLTLPRFDLDQRAAVGDVLRDLGVTAPFDTKTDFEPMSTDPLVQPLRLSDVLHQATVTIDERGTEAAAATAAVFETVGGAIGGVELDIDRPFLFVIHDTANGTPLFIGRVTDPTVA